MCCGAAVKQPPLWERRFRYNSVNFCQRRTADFLLENDSMIVDLSPRKTMNTRWLFVWPGF
jgi:hypothetical protein